MDFWRNIFFRELFQIATNCFHRLLHLNKKSSAVSVHLMGATIAKLLTFMFSDNIVTAFNLLKILHILKNVMISYCVNFKENGAYLYICE